MKIAYSDIVVADRSKLEVYLNELYVQKMSLDKFFSNFLDATELDDDNYETEEWSTYKAKISEYRSIQDNIQTIKARLSSSSVR